MTCQNDENCLQNQASKAFGEELDTLIENFVAEWDIVYENMIGILQIKINNLIHELYDANNEDEEEYKV